MKMRPTNPHNAPTHNERNSTRIIFTYHTLRAKGQNQNKLEVEVNQKGNLRVRDRTLLEPKRQKNSTPMIALITITTMIIILHQVRIEAIDLLMVKAVIGTLEALHKEAED